MIVFLVLCPPSLLAVALGPDTISVWMVAAVLNAALYASIRALVLKLLQRTG